MSSEPALSTLIAQAVRISEEYTLEVSDSFSSRTVTLATGASDSTPLYGVVRLAASGTLGSTEVEAGDLLLHLVTKLNEGTAGLWASGVDSTGHCYLRYLGTGTATIEWDSDDLNAFRQVLGWQSNVSLTEGQTSIAEEQPSHAAFTFAVENDSQWTPLAPWVSVSEMPDGTVYGLADSTIRVVRTFDVRHLPRDADHKEALAALGTCNATTAFPTIERTAQPSASPLVGGPWSWHELLRTALKGEVYPGALYVAIGSFLPGDVGEPSAMDGVIVAICYWTARALQTERQIVPVRSGWGRRAHFEKLELVRYDTFDLP